MDNYLLILIVILGSACIGFLFFLYRYKHLYNHLQDVNHNLADEVRNLRGSLSEFKSKITDLKSANSNKHREIGELHQRISELEADVANKEDEIKKSQQQISKMNSEIVEKDKIIENNRQRILELEKAIQEQIIKSEESAQDPHIENPNDELLDHIDRLKRDNEELKKEKAELKKETDELKGKLANKETTIRIKDDRINELEQKLGIEPIIIEDAKVNAETTPPIQSEGDCEKDTTKRTIDTVVDVETGNEIYAKVFFSQPKSVIFRMRTELQKAIYLHHPKYICKYCGQMVKISGRKNKRGAATFFSHLRDSEDCDYKTTTGRTKREIEREKYSKCNEGERHKKLKDLLATFLLRTSGVTNVRKENTMLGNHPILKWRRPDVAISYRGQEIVFELQLSSTFVSVIAERDLFYRLNKKFIIWVFNFDDQSEHVNLNNMVVEDVYYNHKLNIFIFDKAAYEESLKRGELILKCNWIKSDGSWEYPNINNSDELGGRFVSLSELTYSNDYKPYYYDAEKDYFAHNPLFAQSIISIEEENKKIIEDLDKRLQEEEEALHDFNKRIEDLKEAFEIEQEVKTTKKYLIGKQDGKVGLITFDGDIKIPFEYDSIDGHGNWIEAKKGDTVTLFRRNNYEIVNEGLKYESIGNDLFRIAKYDGEDILWGLMDKRGENIVEAKYSQIEVWNAEKQLLLVVKNGKYGIMSQHGVYVLNCKYDFIGHINSDGYADITLERNTGRIDCDCHVIEETSISLGNSYTKICLMGKWGLENTDTKEKIIECKYDELGSFNGTLVAIDGSHISIVNEDFTADCPVAVQYEKKNERGMLIFKVGNRDALMNIRQQQKAIKKGLKPEALSEMYFSHVNMERGLLYLSATPVIIKEPKQQVEIKDSDFEVGEFFEGTVFYIDKTAIVIKNEDGRTAYIHYSMWGEYSIADFKKGQIIKVVKIGFDDIHKKHIWSILSVA